MTTPIGHLTEIGACDSARRWVAEGKFPDLESAWLACDNTDWLLWYAGRKAGPMVLPIFEKRYPDDKRPRKAIETAEAWVDGKASLKEVAEARSAARNAAAATAAAARKQMRARCVEIIKKHYPTLPV